MTCTDIIEHPAGDAELQLYVDAFRRRGHVRIAQRVQAHALEQALLHHSANSTPTRPMIDPQFQEVIPRATPQEPFPTPVRAAQTTPAEHSSAHAGTHYSRPTGSRRLADVVVHQCLQEGPAD